MKVRWTITVEGVDLKELVGKANRMFTEFRSGVPLRNEEPFFLDVEPDDDMIEDGQILGYKAWASRNFETAE